MLPVRVLTGDRGLRQNRIMRRGCIYKGTWGLAVNCYHSRLLGTCMESESGGGGGGTGRGHKHSKQYCLFQAPLPCYLVLFVFWTVVFSALRSPPPPTWPCPWHAGAPGKGWNPSHSLYLSLCSDNARSLTTRPSGSSSLLFYLTLLTCLLFVF